MTGQFDPIAEQPYTKIGAEAVNSTLGQQLKRMVEQVTSPLLAPLPPFLGPGFRLGARWNRLGQAVETRKDEKKRGKNGRDTA